MSSQARIYNSTDGPLAIDRAGRMLGARETVEADVEASPVAGHIAAGRIVLVDPAPRDDEGEGDVEPKTPKRGRAAASSPQEA